MRDGRLAAAQWHQRCAVVQREHLQRDRRRHLRQHIHHHRRVRDADCRRRHAASGQDGHHEDFVVRLGRWNGSDRRQYIGEMFFFFKKKGFSYYFNFVVRIHGGALFFTSLNGCRKMGAIFSIKAAVPYAEGRLNFLNSYLL